ncbi:MAG TPA: tetratricopeptide repeat protein [Verrucomicrobiota bacterium]|nr:tetratricopeptide repeat protein [Verrucomicrobiota bacterium]HNU51892.1 tetratricopeptide repeat protein [Verrucomicrobiota bacterium]
MPAATPSPAVGPLLAWLWDLLNFSSPLLLLFGLFALWMVIDAIRREEWFWVLFIVIFPFLNAVLYFFLVYRQSAPAIRGFELPGARDRRRIKELQDQIHHLDKAHHHSQLGDIYFQQGKLAKAEACYRAALERDPQDTDTLAHHGQCLLRQKRANEALPLLEQTCAANPNHDYGHTLMALAETYTALGQTDKALATWKRVLEHHTYARARVQLAELYAAAGESEAARAELREVVDDDAHAPAFQRRKDKVWLHRAKALLHRLNSRLNPDQRAARKPVVP